MHRHLPCKQVGYYNLIHYELLPVGKTSNVDLYCHQLTTVMEKLRQLSRRTTSRFRPCLLHDNAAPHRANMTKETLESLGFRVLPHPLYFPDLAPLDFHLFRSLQWFLWDKTLETEEEVKSALKDKEESIASFENGKILSAIKANTSLRKNSIQVFFNCLFLFHGGECGPHI